MRQLFDDNLHSEDDFKRAYAERSWEWYRGLLADLIRLGLRPPVLDLGAGLGVFVECCHQLGIPCIGLEGSSYAVQRAFDRCPNIDIRQHLLSEILPFCDRSIGTVVLNQTIEHLNVPLATHVLKDSRRVLEDCGLIYVSSPSAYNRTEKREPTHVNLYTPSRLEGELLSLGFTGLIRQNTPRQIFGSGPIGRRLVKWMFRICEFDWLSDTADCVAYVNGRPFRATQDHPW